MAKPITPNEVVSAKQSAMPDEVIQAFNELIAEKWEGSSATVKQHKVVSRIVAKFKQSGKNITCGQVFKKHYLDVEDIFRKAGWKVEYDKPGYCEDYEAYFVFSKKSK